ncbi:TolC family protein, partial [Paucibacter sp. XJ19-41]|uniref:TolC family protein n=1 Tax=Paucibacter sp. XJ19-41 TaxID=2927824 RepID=UPI0023496F43
MLIKHSLRRAALLLATSLLLAARPGLAQDGEALRLEPAAETLIERGVKNSAELAGALAKLREAEAELGIARADGAPKLDLKAEAGKAHEQRSDGQKSSRVDGQRRQANLTFRWELDLFGRQRARSQAAQAQQAAVEADLQAARLALANSLRAELLRLRSAGLAQRQRGELLATLQHQQQLEQMLLAAGLRGAGDQLEGEAELEQRRAELAQQEQQRQHALLRLVRLSDIEAGEWQALADGPLPEHRVPAQLPLQS